MKERYLYFVNLVHNVVHFTQHFNFIIYATPSTNPKPKSNPNPNSNPNTNPTPFPNLVFPDRVAKFTVMSNYLRKISRHIDAKPRSHDLTNVA